MEDASVEVEILRRMTPARKIAVVNALIRQAWQLKAAALREARPDIDPAELEALARLSVAGDRT